jgi:hypothetical protein
MLQLSWKPKVGESALRGWLSGFIAGGGGAYAMSLFQRLLMKRRSGAAVDHQQEQQDGARPRRGKKTDDPPTTKAGNAIYHAVSGHDLSDEGKKLADSVMHYAMGTFTGGIYGIASELAPFTSVGAGLPYGSAVWLIADELTVPALGLSKPSTDSPASSHLEAFVAHLIYGSVLFAIQRLIRKNAFR